MLRRIILPVFMRLLIAPFRLYWWVRRPLTLGVQALVWNDAGKILLLRHTYCAGWHLPGGGVKRGEDLCAAIARELEEEVGIETKVQRQDLLAFCYHLIDGRHDHVFYFNISTWASQEVRPRSIEIAEARFFGVDSLPTQLDRLARAQIKASCVAT